MAAPFMERGYANAIMPYFNYIPNPSTAEAAPYISGGYTNLLIGVDQDAAVQSTVRQLHFNGVPNHENM